MPTPSTQPLELLIVLARERLSMNQPEFAAAVGTSVRTLSRWEGGSGSPDPTLLHKLASLLLPVDAKLATDAAAWGGATLEQLGLVKTQPASVPVAATVAAPGEGVLVDSPATRRALADGIVLAAFEGLGDPRTSLGAVRTALRAAFAVARDVGLSPGSVVEGLGPGPEPEPPPAEGAGAPPTGGGRP
jgi:transcriptional regulator with XRE-family HTH domain